MKQIVNSKIDTLLGIIMTGIKWRVLEYFAIFFPNHIFPGLKYTRQ